MITSNTIFSQNTNTQKTFLVSIVFVYDPLEHLTSIPLDMFWLFARFFELNQDSMTLSLRDKTNIDVTISTSRLDGDFPALWSEEGMHVAKEVNLVDVFKTDSALYLGDCLQIEISLHKNRPPFLKGTYVSLHAYVMNICLAFNAISDPSGPVLHNLPIRYLKLASGLDKEIRI